MNKKGQETTETNDNLQENLIYIILGLAFFVIMLLFILNQMNGASKYEDYYSKEIVKVIELSKSGDVITLDIHKATEIAQKNNIVSFNEIFNFDNTNNEVCVKLSSGRKKCYSYVNNVDIVKQPIKLGTPINTLTFQVTEKIKQTNENA